MEDNQSLTAPYTGEEITEAIFDMRPTKAPGEDGFPAVFTRSVGRFWEKTSYTFAPEY